MTQIALKADKPWHGSNEKPADKMTIFVIDNECYVYSAIFDASSDSCRHYDDDGNQMAEPFESVLCWMPISACGKKWIDRSKKLPKDGQRIFVKTLTSTFACEFCEKDFLYKCVDKDGNETTGMFYSVFEWMPVPEICMSMK